MRGALYSVYSMRSNFGHTARDRLKGRCGHLILLPMCLLLGAIGVRADSSEDFEPRVSSASTSQATGVAQDSDPVLSGDEEPTVEPKAALSRNAAVRVDRKGLRIRSGGGAFKAEMHLRSQIRFSTPFASAPRRNGDFFRKNDRDLRFRRARFKSQGEVFRPWIRFKTEYDLVGTRLLDGNVTIQKWDWLQFRFGQWKTEYGRERVDSSGRQEFADRSIVNRQFTLDRQKGIQVLGRLMEGTLADSWYYAGVFTGNGRGFRRSGAGSLDNRDGSPMWVTRYQWNFLRADPGYSQTDVEYHESPVAAVAVTAVSNRSRFTRFSGSGGGRLDGFEIGLPGQFAVKQIAEGLCFQVPRPVPAAGVPLEECSRPHPPSHHAHAWQHFAGRILSAPCSFLGPQRIGARPAFCHRQPRPGARKRSRHRSLVRCELVSGRPRQQAHF